MRARWIPLVILVVTSGCRTAGPAAPPATPTTPPATPAGPAVPIPASIRWVRQSAEHRAVFVQTYRIATAYVEREAARRDPGTWAVALDADETVIDNSVYQLERARQGLPFTPESWAAWTHRREAVPLPGALAFLSRVRALGGRIAIITNRTQAQCPDTEAVFHAYGLAYDVMLCRSHDEPADKNARLRSVVEGTTSANLPPLELVAVLGDNIQDFPGKSQAIRKQGDEAFAEFGAGFFVLPNPIYGSWE